MNTKKCADSKTTMTELVLSKDTNEVYIEVHTNRITGHEKVKSNHAYMTFVALDLNTGKPLSVSNIESITKEEMQRFESANRRKEIRLILGKRLKPKDAKEVIDYFAEFAEEE